MLDPRTCIVCNTDFTPRRKDQVLCTTAEDRECRSLLRQAERRAEDNGMHHVAYEAGGGRCWKCRALAKTEPLHTLLVRPSDAFDQSSDAWPEGGIAMSCTPCRRDYYQQLSQHSA